MRRREALSWMGITAVAGAIGPPWSAELLFGQTRPSSTRAAFLPDVELALRAAPGNAQILPGASTRVWKFSGQVLKGPADALRVLPNSYLGPTIRLQKGQRVRIRFANALPESTTVHWHGLDVPSEMDGHPHRLVEPGKEFVYEFGVLNRAGTYWYHPHPHSRTGPQVYRGLAGLLLISDPDEASLTLPSGTEDLECVIQDRRFDRENQFVYLGAGMGMMDQMRGFLGDRVLINGLVGQTLPLGTRAYRLRLLNASNARIYKLVWSDGTPMTIIGSDGGLLERPHAQSSVTLAPAQRADVWLDLSDRPVGSRFELRSASFPSTDVDTSGMGMGMGAMMSGMAGALPHGAPISLLSIQVTRRESSALPLPTRLSTFDATWTREASAPVRRIPLTFQAGQWQLDGRTFDMMAATAEETVAAGASQIWELANTVGMMGMQMAHPIHLHGRQFRVLSRQRAPGAATEGKAVREGLNDEGWKDTVLVMPGETVRILVNFTRYPGLYLYHCHILEHEDMGMMRNFRVV